MQCEPAAAGEMPRALGVRYAPENYDALLDAKVAATREQFAAHLEVDTPFQIYASERSHFRCRARFAVGRLAPDGPLRYVVWAGGGPSVVVDEFPIASREINTLMPRLLDELNASAILASGLDAVHFLGTSSGDDSDAHLW